MAGFSFGGPLAPEEASRVAAATHAERIPDGEPRFAAADTMPQGFRALAEIAKPSALRPMDTSPVPAADHESTAS